MASMTGFVRILFTRSTDFGACCWDALSFRTVRLGHLTDLTMGGMNKRTVAPARRMSGVRCLLFAVISSLSLNVGGGGALWCAWRQTWRETSERR